MILLKPQLYTAVSICRCPPHSKPLTPDYPSPSLLQLPHHFCLYSSPQHATLLGASSHSDNPHCIDSTMPTDSHRQRIIKRSTKTSNNPFLCATIPGLAIQATMTALPFLFLRSIPQPMRTSVLSGEAYVNELLTSNNPRRIQEVLRMNLEVFRFLCTELKNKGGLAPSRYVGVEEQVAMFLHAIAHSRSNREVQERFQHSGETVSRHFHSVLQALNQLVPHYINLPKHEEPPDAISNNPKFYPFFSDCIGALDGTHIAAKVPTENAAAFRNRKGYLSQNVLACCDFDKLVFTFVFTGWERVSS
jgi:hypothetical protein